MPFNAVFSWIIKKRIEQINLFTNNPVKTQQQVFKNLIKKGTNTSFGKDHSFHDISTYKEFKELVPLRQYEDFSSYIDKAIKGKEDVLWPGQTKWFSKSSGTTSNTNKLIPVSEEAIQDCHYNGGKDLLSLYYHNNPKAKLFTGKHLILGGNTSVNKLNEESYFGDLSAIIVKNLPFWAEIRRTPSKKIALLPNWDEKIEKMAKAAIKQDVRILAGVPSWMLVLLHKVIEVSGKNNIMEVWPNLVFYMHGGVNFEPYRNQFEELIQNPNLNYYQTYNASEGFFALQNVNKADDMLLMLDYGIFYEFIPMDVFKGNDSETIGLKDVEVGKNYALVITTNAGLWRYIIGDTIMFTSTHPFKIKVTGRTKHFINAFGEELIIDNADEALKRAMSATNSSIKEYTGAPVYFNKKESGAHQWIIEFNKSPKDLPAFVSALDKALQDVNGDYKAKRSNDFILRQPEVKIAPNGVFHHWLEQKGKLGGQNKIPRLSNDRTFINEIIDLCETY